MNEKRFFKVLQAFFYGILLLGSIGAIIIIYFLWRLIELTV